MIAFPPWLQGAIREGPRLAQCGRARERNEIGRQVQFVAFGRHPAYTLASPVVDCCRDASHVHEFMRGWRLKEGRGYLVYNIL